MKKIISMVMVIGISIALSAAVFAEEFSTFTLLIYMNGSDLESEYQSATADLLEMIEGHVGDDVAIIIETGGTKRWHTGEAGLPQVSSLTNQRWRLTDTGLVHLEDVTRSNMGATETLENFLDYGMTNYPSDQYGLIMWNHGAGAVYGYGADEKYGYDTLTLDEFQQALETTYVKHEARFDLVGFDACLMASIETAHVLAPYASYLVGSEELEPGHGWHYTPVIDYISSSDDPEPVTLGEVIINGFVEQAETLGTKDAITMSLIDLSKTEAVTAALDDLLQRVIQGIHNGVIKDELMKARLAAESYGEGNEASDIPDSDMVDIIDYATILNEFYPYQAENLVLAVQDAVIKDINSPYKPNAAGLSVYIPAKDKETMSEASGFIGAIDMSEAHIILIELMNEIINGNSNVIDYEEAITEVNATTAYPSNLENNSIEGDDQFYYFNVEKEDMSAISEVMTVMGRLDNSGDIQYLAKDRVDDEGILEDGVIIGETLEYWVQINGTDVAMYYENLSDSGVMNYFIPITLNGEDADLIVLFSAVYPSGKILGARKLNRDNENIYNRSLIALDPDDLVEFIFEYDAYNILKDSYDYDSWYAVSSMSVGKGLQLSWNPLQEGDYAYAFEITDIYGNVFLTDWIKYSQAEGAVGIDLVDDAIWDNLDENAVLEAEQYPWLSEGVEMPSLWAIPHVSTAYNNGLTTERTLVDFKNDITRETFCELVVTMYEKSTDKVINISNTHIFDDTDNSAVAKAYSIGVVNGYGNGLFGPDDAITREQLMTMFYRAMLKLDGSIASESMAELTFTDIDALASWAWTPAGMLVKYGLIDGVGNNRLAPDDQASIEQSLKLVNGVYEFVAGR